MSLRIRALAYCSFGVLIGAALGLAPLMFPRLGASFAAQASQAEESEKTLGEGLDRYQADTNLTVAPPSAEGGVSENVIVSGSLNSTLLVFVAGVVAAFSVFLLSAKLWRPSF